MSLSASSDGCAPAYGGRTGQRVPLLKPAMKHLHLSLSRRIHDSDVSRRIFATTLAPLLLFLVIVDSYPKEKREGVRKQLADLQRESGITLANVFLGIGTVDFAHRSFSGRDLPPPVKDAWKGIVSPDGTEVAFWYRLPRSDLGIARRDGTMIAEYREIVDPEDYCWAPDESKLVVRAKLASSATINPPRSLFILNLASGATREIDPNGSVSAQCWSPDSRQIVYTSSSGIRIYDLLQKSSRGLTGGGGATWSPDGEWIAFPADDGYYAIRPSGTARRLLFKKKNAYSHLLWSPDSRIVAYETPTRNLTFFDPTRYCRIRVRRLADGSDDWVAVVAEGQEVVWIRPEPAKH